MKSRSSSRPASRQQSQPSTRPPSPGASAIDKIKELSEELTAILSREDRDRPRSAARDVDRPDGDTLITITENQADLLENQGLIDQKIAVIANNQRRLLNNQETIKHNYLEIQKDFERTRREIEQTRREIRDLEAGQREGLEISTGRLTRILFIHFVYLLVIGTLIGLGILEYLGEPEIDEETD